MENQMNFLYDHTADVLYVSKGHPVYTDYVELNDDVILRLDPLSKEVVGFTIVDFISRFSKEALPFSVPLSVTFEQARKKQRTRVLAEKRAVYSVNTRKRAKQVRDK